MMVLFHFYDGALVEITLSSALQHDELDELETFSLFFNEFNDVLTGKTA
jgi:hypothetical protein